MLYQLGLFRGGPSGQTALLNRVGVLFSVSSLANTAWVFAWHYDVIRLSAVLIVTILVCLILITDALRVGESDDTSTVAGRGAVQRLLRVDHGRTVANITVLLVSLNWDGFGTAGFDVGRGHRARRDGIGTVTMLRNRDIAYGLVLIWAYPGILLRQTSADGLRPLPGDHRRRDRLAGGLRRRRGVGGASPASPL